MRKLVIMRGLPGSGKSYKAVRLDPNAAICSADDYFMRPDGYYDFNGRLLKRAHNWCYSLARQYLEMHDRTVIIDNTNVRLCDFIKYIDLAVEHNIPWTIVEPDTPWKFSVEHLILYNTHGVPFKTLLRNLRRWEPTNKILRQLPPNAMELYVNEQDLVYQ